jgi:hypothetical protein
VDAPVVNELTLDPKICVPTTLAKIEDVVMKILLVVIAVKLLVNRVIEEKVLALAIPFTSRGVAGAATLIPTLLLTSIVKAGIALLPVVGKRRAETPVSILK